MVKGGGVFLLWFDLVKAFDPTVHPVADLSGETLDNCSPRRTLLTNDPAAGRMNELSHFSRPSPPSLRRSSGLFLIPAYQMIVEGNRDFSLLEGVWR
jgi:hypothetical protein